MSAYDRLIEKDKSPVDTDKGRTAFIIAKVLFITFIAIGIAMQMPFLRVFNFFSMAVGVLCYYIGEKKAIGPRAAYAYGYFLNIIGLIIVLTSESTAQKQQREQAMLQYQQKLAQQQLQQQQATQEQQQPDQQRWAPPQQQVTQRPDTHQTPPPLPSMMTDNNLDRLMKLAELKERGHISQEEFDIQKSKLL